MSMREWVSRLRDRFRRNELDAELNEELRFHRAQLERDTGSRTQLGNATRIREESRDRWSFAWLDVLEQDLRYALRGLWRSPGFTATVVITLGLGIGANAAMFGVIDRLMFRPYAMLRDPASVHRVYLQTNYQGRANASNVFPYTRFVDLRRATTSFAEYVAISDWQLAVGSGDAARVRKVSGVSASLFDFFDAPPARGRYFTAAEDSIPDGVRVAVISYALWQSDFQAANIPGHQVKIGWLDYTIIGVAPKGFVGVSSGKAPDVFVPITTIPANLHEPPTFFADYRWDWTEMIVRRRPSVSVETANSDLTRAYIQSRATARAGNPRILADSLVHPQATAGAPRIAAGPGAGRESRVLLWVTGVAGIVLLIACANVSNLMFARVLRRRREITVRLALGVGRRRLAAQFVTESLLLALLGCIAGLLVAQWGGVAIRTLLLPEGSGFNLTTDWRTLGVAALCALVAALLSAVGPAIVASRTDLAASLKAGVREGTSQRSRTRSALLVLQGALSVALLVGAGLFVRSLDNVRAIPLGYDVTSVLEVTPDFRGVQGDSASKVVVRRRLLATAEAIPGVEYATRVNSRLFGSNTAELRVPGVDSLAKLGRFNIQLGSPNYFKVVGTRILRGRGFTEADREGSQRVAIVSDEMSRVIWPGKNPIGECIYVSWNPEKSTPCTTIVGIAENAAQQMLTDDPGLMYYLPVEQMAPHQVGRMWLRVSGSSAGAHMERVRRELTKVMPGDGFVVVRQLQEVVDDQSRSWRLGATLFVAFGGLALLVAAVGLYGVIAYSVAQRMHELGVRVALGARAADVVRLVVSQGLYFAAAGVAVGLGVAWFAGKWIQPLLFKQSATDPATYGIVAAVMIAVALMASAVPAMRASRADPNVALRSD